MAVGVSEPIAADVRGGLLDSGSLCAEPCSGSCLRSGRAGNPKFEYVQSPPHWRVTLDGQFCDQVGESALFLGILDALEEEGGWKLSTTQAITQSDVESLQQSHYECHKFFFTRVM